ncbi:hypothetical protein MACH09_27630 [Vibrio sp. MACH09]|nr:hypothetical protein MACH09_27630 [Vibrio sp. MACH09]
MDEDENAEHRVGLQQTCGNEYVLAHGNGGDERPEESGHVSDDGHVHHHGCDYDRYDERDRVGDHVHDDGEHPLF